jgi:hypothetical protein
MAGDRPLLGEGCDIMQWVISEWFVYKLHKPDPRLLRPGFISRVADARFMLIIDGMVDAVYKKSAAVRKQTS